MMPISNYSQNHKITDDSPLTLHYYDLPRDFHAHHDDDRHVPLLPLPCPFYSRECSSGPQYYDLLPNLSISESCDKYASAGNLH
jgi:hypothetical protein